MPINYDDAINQTNSLDFTGQESLSYFLKEVSTIAVGEFK